MSRVVVKKMRWTILRRSLRRRDRAGQTFLAAALVVCAVVLQASETRVASNAPSFRLTPDQFDLGVVGHNEKKSVRFTIENLLDQPLVLAAPKSSCDCMKVVFALQPLSPGEKREGEVQVSLGRGFGAFSKHVDFALQAGQQPVTSLTIEARFHPDIAIANEEKHLSMFGVFGGTAPDARRNVTIRRSRPQARAPTVENVEVVASAFVKQGLRVAAKTTTDAAAGTVTIGLELDTEQPEGNFSGELRCTVNGLALVVPISGTVYRGLRASPDLFNFNRIDDLVKAEQRVELFAVDGRAFRILDITYAPGPQKQGVPAQLDVSQSERAGGGYVLTAKLRAPYPSSGGISGEFTIKTDHPERPEYRIKTLGFIPETTKRP
ncbi:MAG: DUF1573 domain-containing protein [Planctomycetota bacterium]